MLASGLSTRLCFQVSLAGESVPDRPWAATGARLSHARTRSTTAVLRFADGNLASVADSGVPDACGVSGQPLWRYGGRIVRLRNAIPDS